MMENKFLDRQNSLYEHLSTMQTLCIFILMLGFIEYKHVISIYPPYNMRVFALLSLIGLGAVLLYNSVFFHNIDIRGSRPQDNSNYNSLIKYVYVIIPFLIVMILFRIKENGFFIETIVILPVLFTATVMGKNASYALSTVCTLVLILNRDISLNSLVRAFESNIFLICTMYMSGWFVGGLMDIEAQHREQLKQSVLSLKEEMARREQMEKEMARLDRLNTIGEMAAAIGHEIRNPMTTVRGFLQLLGRKQECIKYKDFYDLMIEELDRANSIITEFLSLAKNKAINLKPSNLSCVVKAILPLINADATKANKYVVAELYETPDLLLDEGEIRQIILNLVRNGLEAMSPGGRLTIRTETDGKEAVLAVQDEGKGIEREVLEKIGTPFFTTKDYGTGLGLAVCYSIAARHNAVINVETGPKGTTFYVRFKLSNTNGVMK